MHASLIVEGGDTDATALWDWLRRDPELRGMVRARRAQPAAGTMGATTELVVNASVAVAGAGAIWAALARSLSVWLTQRRSDITVRVTGSDGRTVSVEAKRVADPEALLREVLGLPAER